MKFELFGNRSLVDICIRYPVCSAEQPADILKNFGRAWEEAQNDMGLQKAIEQSLPNDDPRLSKQIRALRQVADRAAWIREWIAGDWNNWDWLSSEDRKLYRDFDAEANRRQIDELRARQQPKFPGAGSSIARTM